MGKLRVWAETLLPTVICLAILLGTLLIVSML